MYNIKTALLLKMYSVRDLQVVCRLSYRRRIRKILCSPVSSRAIRTVTDVFRVSAEKSFASKNSDTNASPVSSVENLSCFSQLIRYTCTGGIIWGLSRPRRSDSPSKLYPFLHFYILRYTRTTLVKLASFLAI